MTEVLGVVTNVPLTGDKVLSVCPHEESNGATATFDLSYADSPGEFGHVIACQNITREAARALRDALTAWLEPEQGRKARDFPCPYPFRHARTFCGYPGCPDE